MEKYQKIEKIGEGSYGVVYKGRNKVTGELVALKKVRLDTEDEGVPASTIREVALLKSLTHENIVRLTDVVQDKQKLHLVFEYIDLDLKHYLDQLISKNEPIDGLLVKSYLSQLVKAVNYCHSKGILHRDLKPPNLLIDQKGILKLADFGLARAIGFPIRTLTHEVVTLWYRAPEILLGSQTYTKAVDVWAIGCIFMELLTLKPLFPGDSEIDQLYKIFKSLGTPTESTWPGVTKLPDFKTSFPKWTSISLSHTIGQLKDDAEVLDLVQRMLKYNPSERITTDEILMHPYFNELQTTTTLSKEIKPIVFAAVAKTADRGGVCSSKEIIN